MNAITEKENKLIITDANIDYSTAKIWCAFASNEFQTFAADSKKTIDKLKQEAEIKFKDDKDKDNDKDKENSKTINESEYISLEESIYQFFINERSTKHNKKDGFFKGSLKALGKTTGKVLKGTAKLAGKLTAKTLKYATKYAIKGLIAGTKLTAKGVLWITKKTYNTITPWVKAKSKATFALGEKSDSLAFAKFKCNDKKYVFTYNLSKSKWFLAYDGIGGIFNNDSVPGKSEIASFKKTQFFKKFVKKCSSTIKKYLDDDAFIGILVANTTSINTEIGNYLMRVQKNKENIQNNMFTGNIQPL